MQTTTQLTIEDKLPSSDLKLIENPIENQSDIQKAKELVKFNKQLVNKEKTVAQQNIQKELIE
ncbi:hypothetical protein KA082_01620 [Candidatus Woesebacteria bacterium]|nr:hypothetical protein [Candidatus Woesebacteria bacterium]